MKESQLKLSIVTKAFNIEDALTNEKCPYCGHIHKESRQIHYDNCVERQKNLETDKTAKNDRWAFHQIYGRVLIVGREYGLYVICADYGPERQVVPINALKFGVHTKILEAIEETELPEEEIETVINILRVKLKNFTKLPKYPKLWPGCRVEIQFGDYIRKATIKSCKTNSYTAVADGKTSVVNISPKHIIRIL